MSRGGGTRYSNGKRFTIEVFFIRIHRYYVVHSRRGGTESSAVKRISVDVEKTSTANSIGIDSFELIGSVPLGYCKMFGRV
jgi:hypothetical protein